MTDPAYTLAQGGARYCTPLRGHLAATYSLASPAARPLRPVSCSAIVFWSSTVICFRINYFCTGTWCALVSSYLLQPAVRESQNKSRALDPIGYTEEANFETPPIPGNFFSIRSFLFKVSFRFQEVSIWYVRLVSKELNDR